jgi:hypothetical protein
MTADMKLTQYMSKMRFQVSRRIPIKVVVLLSFVPGPKCKNWLVNPPSLAINIIYKVKYTPDTPRIVFGDDRTSATLSNFPCFIGLGVSFIKWGSS